MKKYLIISTSFLLLLSSCTKNISRFNEQTKSPSNVPPSTLFSNAVRTLTDGLASTNVNTNVYRLVVQHWATTTYQDEPNYDFTTRNIPQSWWSRMYRDVLVDLKEAQRLIPSDINVTDEGQRKNQIAISDVMQVFTYSVLVNTFGNVPYTEALDPSNLFPKYDDAKSIYDALFTRLDADIAAMNASSGGFSATADLVYGGSVAKWIKFANSLKMKLGMMVADVDVNKAKAAVEAADANAFQSASDNAVFAYLKTTPNTNPIWVDLIQSNRQDFVAGNTLIDKLKTLNDPRLSLYFKPNDAGQYVGGKLGSNNTFSDYAKVADKVTAQDYPALLLDYVEMEFYRAEAKERGFNVSGTAEQHYNNAIRASILYWGGTSAQADAYLALPSVAYTTATGTYKEKIGTQKWIALQNRGYEGWTEYRRLDFPVLVPPTTAKSGFPDRFTYPTNEQTLNNANYTEAAAKMGGDKVEGKIFWDKF
jgi:hypothetical protein